MTRAIRPVMVPQRTLQKAKLPRVNPQNRIQTTQKIQLPKNSVCFLFLFCLLLTTISCTERRQDGLLTEAEHYIGDGKHTEASSLLRKVVALDPESKAAAKAMYKLGFLLESYLKDYEGALLSYQEFSRLSQDSVSRYEVLKRVANLYFEYLNDPEKAAETYEKIIELSPDSLERDFLRFRLGKSFFRTNDFEKARQQYQMLIDEFPKSQLVASARFEIGNSYYMEGKYEVAIEALKQVLRHHAGSDYAIEAQFQMAQCLEHQDKLADALATYEAIRENYPSRKVVDFRLASLQKRMKKSK
jgi:tetratricopeptide (TPR) repeat protein